MGADHADGPPPPRPVWADEQVHVAPADPTWAGQGVAAAAGLAQRLNPWLVGEVEHVGSTAVAGLDAKPVLDLQAPVEDFGCAGAVADVLAPDGWHFVGPHLDGRAWRRFFVRVVEDRRTAHLHLLQPDHPRWREQIRFRDALRADPRLARRYGILKHELAASHTDDREAYTSAKARFVGDVLAGRDPG